METAESLGELETISERNARRDAEGRWPAYVSASFLRRRVNPTAPKPNSIIIQVAGSGIADVGGV